MKFTNIGGATAIVEHGGKRMLFDPWLDDGIFHGSWFHWPPALVSLDELGRFDYVYISHIHEDHCSAGTIRHINRDAQIIIMDRQPNFVLNFLRANGFDFAQIHLVPPRKGLQIADDLFVDMIEADPGNEMAYLIDSSIVISWGGKIVFNANDCQPHPAGVAYLKENYPEIDLALLPYSGGSGYPGCYSNLSDDEKLAERDRILRSRIAGFIENTKAIAPKHVVPFADQYVVAGERAYLNRYISHGSCPGVVVEQVDAAGLSAQLLLLNSGQSFDLGTEQKTPNEPYRFFTEAERDAYIQTHLSDASYDHERVTFGPSVPIDRLVQYARARLWDVQRRRNTFSDTQFILEFLDSGRRFSVNLAEETAHELQPGAALQEPYLRIGGADTLMSMLLIGHVSWNIADAALFLDYERKPNRYDPSVYVLLNFLRV